MGNELSSQDAELLRASFEVALRAVAAGNHPFGAILANEQRQILLEAENTVVTGDDITGHAETNLVRMVGKESYGAALESCTLYASSEPCAMCFGAIPWSGVDFLVCGARKSDAEAAGFDEGEKVRNWVESLRERGIDVELDVMRDESARIFKYYRDTGGVVYNARPQNS